jgi:hypothetical protein
MDVKTLILTIISVKGWKNGHLQHLVESAIKYDKVDLQYTDYQTEEEMYYEINRKTVKGNK